MAMGILGEWSPQFFLSQMHRQKMQVTLQNQERIFHALGAYLHALGAYLRMVIFPALRIRTIKIRILGGETLPAAGLGSVTRIPPIG